jgi:spermidine/putrescine-binding protein
MVLVRWQSASIIEAAVGAFLVPTPPINLTGSQLKNKFASQTDRVNVLNWDASLDPSVQYYFVYRNDVLIGIVPASVLQYEDHHQSKKPTEYKVTAVNASNVQSAPVIIVIH